MTKRIKGSHVVIFKNDSRKEVFLVWRSDYPIWGLTGGGIKKGENPKKAAIREAFEETGFKVKIIKKLGTIKMYNGEKFIGKCHLYEGRRVSGKFVPEFPGCRGKWFNTNSLPLRILKQTREQIQIAKGKKEVPTKLQNNMLKNYYLLFLNPISSIKFLLKIK